ncbi:hypothetical protein FOZ60_015755 [Perkinsus olseni]|uniref:ABC transporter domain-containing protein n=1 Tax=Perkinsus olseni TaxID=32597 RepID=A0A7J6P5F1_PEROL|nr:hypothetical protein FOZ60_015755 [Perkinsus olseni]
MDPPRSKVEDLEAGGAMPSAYDLHFPLPKRVPSLGWKKISFSIGKREILKDCSGSINPGEFTAILGPSGSGKTTLMNILSGRQDLSSRNKKFEGVVMLDGQPTAPSTFRESIAYVMQEDALVSTSTPREILEFSATLKLKRGKREIKTIVDDMLEYLRLSSCQNTMVGNQLTRGISGGERKRTSIGVELITQPSMIFLDEPLTGLDSYAAVTTSRVLKGLAKRGVTVLMTVHQPSSEVFELFDRVMIINEGQIAYHGPRASLSDFFSKHAGLNCPPHHNFGDFALYTLQTEPPEVINRLVDGYKAEIADGDANISPAKGGSTASTSNCLMLSKRELRSVVRDPGILLIRYAVILVTGILLACIFHNSGRAASETFWLTNLRLFQPYFSAVVIMCLMQLFGPAQTAIIRYPEQRMVFLREYTGGMYSVIPYVISKTMVELPLALLECFIHLVVSYWIINFQGNFFFWLLLTWLLNLVSCSLAQLLGATTSTISRAMQMMPLLFIPQIAFSGLFISLERVPVWLRWGQYVSYLKYGVNLGYFVEFGFDKPELAEINSIHSSLVGLDIGVLLGMLILFRTLTIVVLKRKARFVQ